jgi:3-dehydroquinate synthase
MGTGKTTVGRILARQYGLEFVDTDDEIEWRAGRTVAEVFAEDGEATFRELESQVLRDALQDSGKVIATGGGTLMSLDNRVLLEQRHTVMCLTCGPDEIGRRLGDARERPLFDAGSPHSVQTLLSERERVYSLYPRIDTTDRSPDEVAESIAEAASLERAASLSIAQAQKYDVMFGEGMVERAGELMWERGLSGQAFILTDSRVAELDVCTAVRSSLKAAGGEVSTHVIPEGEQFKTLETMEGIYSAALQSGLDRSSVIVGIGGGVVSDMAGMLAATYLRGLHLVLVPTTLLAQVDAAIGGKVGVDFHAAKNMIGAFKPAKLVLIDPRTLTTLPPSTLADGVVEIIKIGFIRSRHLVSQLEDVDPARILDYPHVIRYAARQKVEVVQNDLWENGDRMLLNFGHTIGHGLEAASEYRLSHGRAVSIGMMIETRMAVSQGWCSESTFETLLVLLRNFSLPTETDDIDLERVLHFVGQDKKRHAGKIRLAVPRDIGDGMIVDVTLDDIRATLKEIERV